MNTQKNINPIETLEKVKAHDSKMGNITKRFTILYFVFVVIYLGIFVLNPDPELKLVERIGGICYVISFLIFGIYFNYYQKMIKRLDYTRPLIEVIKQAKKRYGFMPKESIWAFLAMIIMGIGITMSIEKRVGESLTILERRAIIISIYSGIMLIAVVAGYIRWRLIERPIWLKIKNILEEE